MTKLERLRKEIPADLPDDWSCIVRAGDVRSLLDAVEALRSDVAAEVAAMDEWNRLYPRIPWKESHAVIERLRTKQVALAALDKEESC